MDVVFHARLGSMKDKAERVSELSRALCISCAKSGSRTGQRTPISEQAYRAGLLCKADLVTEMVGEFPDLQGTMGGYYAKN